MTLLLFLIIQGFIAMSDVLPFLIIIIMSIFILGIIGDIILREVEGKTKTIGTQTDSSERISIRNLVN